MCFAAGYSRQRRMASKWSLLLLAILLDAGKERERKSLSRCTPVFDVVYTQAEEVKEQKKEEGRRRKE